MLSQKEAPKDLAGVLDESANTLFLTELWRGLVLTLKVFFEQPVTVGGAGVEGSRRAEGKACEAGRAQRGVGGWWQGGSSRRLGRRLGYDLPWV